MNRNAKNDSEKWFKSILKTTSTQPISIPVIGIKIECRLLINDKEDWQYVQEILDSIQQWGAAEIIEYKTFGE